MTRYNKITKIFSLEDFHKSVDKKKYKDFFTTEEIKRYASRKNKGGLAARYFLKKEIIEYYKNEIKFSDIEILNEKSGKPVFCIKKKEETARNIFFSLSHTKTHIAIIIIFNVDKI